MGFISLPAVLLAYCLIFYSSVLAKEEDITREDPGRSEYLVAKVNDEGMIEIEDMVLTPEMFKLFYPLVDQKSNGQNVTVHRRAATNDRSRLWPGARIPYYFSNLAGPKEAVLKAMGEWMANTCIRFVPRSPQDKIALEIRAGQGCGAAMGYVPNSHIDLHANCFQWHGILLHELGHVIGLTHEHQHPDRDQFLTINWHNLKPEDRIWYEVDKQSSSWGIAYDPTSVMHYGDSAELCNGGACATMVSKIGAKLMQYSSLSRKSDIPIVNKMYCSGGK